MCALKSFTRLGHASRVASVTALLIVSCACHAQSPQSLGIDRNSGLDVALASPATCVACHGASGAGTADGAPRLAGKNPDYLAHALSMFKAGTRASDVMQTVARNLSDSEMRDLAVYFSNQHPPLAKGAVPPSPRQVTAGKQLAEMGAAPDVPACFSCHAAGGKGNGARFPGIAGEPAAFVVGRLHEFQTRAKASTPAPGTMTAVAAKLTDSQIKEAAAYLSVLTP